MTQLRRLALLATALAAMLAVAGPAVAQAEGPYWYVGNEKVGEEEEKQQFEATGSMMWELWGSSVTVGPCTVEASGHIWNGESGGEGQIDSFETIGPCYSNSFGTKCEQAEFGSSFAEGPWPLALTESEGQEVDISGFNVATIFKGCPGSYPNGIPISWSGTLDGSWNDLSGAIEYSHAGSLKGPSGNTYTNGSLELSAEGGEITAGPISPPKATTGVASDLGLTLGVLNGTVNPEGRATTYQFEYGETAGYGSKAPVSPASAGSGTKSITVSSGINGLTPQTTYHYRIVATGPGGTVYGKDQAFQTAGVGPLWYIGGNLLGEHQGEGEPVKLSGEFTFSAFGGAWAIGPCDVTGNGTLWNDQQGVGALSWFEIDSPCPVTAFGKQCKAVGFSNYEEELPISAGEVPGEVWIEEFSTAVFYEGCPVLPNGVPIPMSGTIQGLWNNESSRIEYNQSGQVEAGWGPMLIDGALEVTSENGAVTHE
jgi:hypothetical protein